MFYLSPSNTELCRRFLYLFVSGVIIAWQAKPDVWIAELPARNSFL